MPKTWLNLWKTAVSSLDNPTQHNAVMAQWIVNFLQYQTDRSHVALTDAAEAMLTDYESDDELTISTTLDGEEFNA